MANTSETPAEYAIPTSSHDTALCVIPPTTDCGDVDRLRELYDKAYGSWPAHVNLIYPFVAPESLPRAQQQIQAHFDRNLEANEAQTVTLDEPGMFKHRNNSTIFLQEARRPEPSCLATLRAMALPALGQESSASNLHLTVGQTVDNTLFSQQFLLNKVRLLPAVCFRIGALAILVRERAAERESAPKMKLWGVIHVTPTEHIWIPRVPEYWLDHLPQRHSVVGNDEDASELLAAEQSDFSREVQPGSTFYFDTQNDRWVIYNEFNNTLESPRTVTVASYNVLIDSEYPPARDRDPHVLRTILSNAATADVLVLQEVSDDFLSYLLQNREVRERFPFTSHGPPDQADIGPLSSLRNVVTVSRWPFSWTFVPFHRRHKGALVAKFAGLVGSDLSSRQDLIVAGVHLTCGLTDGSVAAKRVQVQNLLSHLSRHHSTTPWIITGDFNLATSTYTINTALKDKSISSQTVATLSSIETTMSEAGLVDAWAVAHIEAKDAMSTAEELFEGEEGATFDPRNNVLAAATSGTSANRPQRYDRVLFRPQDSLQVSAFNHFGLAEEIDGAHVVPSDHYGVRGRFSVLMELTKVSGKESKLPPQLNVQLIRATLALSPTELETSLAAHHMFPSEEEVQQRQQAFGLLRQVVLGLSDEGGSGAAELPMVMVPVGSYALGAWTCTSDIDCLCVGTISSKTFFRLARQRLVKAEGQGIRILRKVEAGTGTMLELLVEGVAMDLQYCPAARVVEGWSEFRDFPASDPIFNLSILSLRKLKPYRDLLYIQRTLPSMSVFRLAYRCIKLWAVQHGIYSAKFGYLGGVHITLILSWVFKAIAHDQGSSTAADLVTSFFHHFAHFDWANCMSYDAFFHQASPRYHRSSREPMVVLGYHAPNSNIAHTATVPGLRTLVKEAKKASDRLATPDMTWAQFFDAVGDSQIGPAMSNGATSFLQSHNNYIKIDIQFWGRTIARGKSLVGWVESRCLSLVVDIHKALPHLEVRIWPARFTNRDSSDSGSDYHGCYLIGLSKSPDSVAPSTSEDKLLAKQILDKIVDRFLTQLKTDEKNYDSTTCWIGISVAGLKDVMNLRLDDREWGDYTADFEPDSDDEQDEDEVSDELPEVIKRTIPQRPKPTATPVSTSKLRPASDVINRLRWDPALDPADYVIGYEDRFLGAKETSLEKWKTEQTDEEFIPQHRVLYFKKRGVNGGDDEIVWERVTRIDKVFGSGAGAGIAYSMDVFNRVD